MKTKRIAAATVAGVSLIGCLAAPVLHFQGTLEEDAYRTLFGIATAGWFLGATAWTVLAKKIANHQ
jgi:hypothetical protein